MPREKSRVASATTREQPSKGVLEGLDDEALDLGDVQPGQTTEVGSTERGDTLAASHTS